MPDEFEPKIVAFFCNWCTYLAADLAGTSRIKYVPNAEVVRAGLRVGRCAGCGCGGRGRR